jgi:hypothetical protein
MVNVFVFFTPPDVTEMSTVWAVVTLAKAMVEFTRVLPAAEGPLRPWEQATPETP